MLSKSRISFISSLKIKKYREIHRQFIAEGSKLVLDLLKSHYIIKECYASASWINEIQPGIIPGSISVNVVDEAEMGKITCLSTPSRVLALVEIPENRMDFSKFADLVLVLDDIRDPGNLGTIIRIADWFGVETVICSENSVDLYNPKVVQATMGSIARVNVIYEELEAFFQKLPVGIPVYGTFLRGENIYTKDLDNKGILIIGNEAKGISKVVEKYVTDRLFIPGFRSYETSDRSADSLNASVATAIVCSEFRRRLFR
jgi:RNA methyltransferase, TrmH family